jgi:predicted DNA-binding transcriptional regulator YafY
MNKGQTLVKMLELMTRRGGVRGTELVERFELDARTLRRYLADLKELDIPIQDEGRGDDRVIAVDPRWKRTGVQLSLTEVLSLHFGRTLFNFLEGTSFASDLDGAIERLEPAISRAHQDLARQLDTKFIAVPEHYKDYRGDTSEIIDEVITALVYQHPIDARYRKPNGLRQNYKLHPYTLGVFRQGLYLFAFDIEAGQVKTFAIERFTDLVRRSRERFEYSNRLGPARPHRACVRDHLGTARRGGARLRRGGGRVHPRADLASDADFPHAARRSARAAPSRGGHRRARDVDSRLRSGMPGARSRDARRPDRGLAAQGGRAVHPRARLT